MIKDVSPEEAQFLIWRSRNTVRNVREAPTFEQKRNTLAIAGYPVAKNVSELDLIIRTLMKAGYPGRSSGMY